MLRRSPSAKSERGFTLIELIVVVIILSVLAAVAIPRFVSFAREARIASLKTLGGAVDTAANQVHMLCGVDQNSGCNYANFNQLVIFMNRYVSVNYGWPNAGGNLNNSEIDSFVHYTGFTADLPNALQTRFSLDDAPVPTNCSVTYEEGTFQADQNPTITLTTSGC